MDPELRRAISELHALAADNHRMLRAIRRDQWFGFIGKLIFWIVLFIAPFYLYQHYVAPLVTKIQSTPGTAVDTMNASLPSFAQMQNLVHSFLSGL
jgi:hypothetical protein